MKLLVDRRRAAASTRSPGSSRSSPRVQKVFVAPGNGGTAREPRVRQCRDHRASPQLVDVREARNASTSPSSAPRRRWPTGVVDAFQAAGLTIFGADASRGAARKLQGLRQGVHGAPRHSDGAHRTFTDARRCQGLRRRSSGAPIVVKADGLAAGKGVVVATTREEAHAAIDAHARREQLRRTPARAS